MVGSFARICVVAAGGDHIRKYRETYKSCQAMADEANIWVWVLRFVRVRTGVVAAFAVASQ
eukprot:6558857-Pyramimonas_sp.AAC.1